MQQRQDEYLEEIKMLVLKEKPLPLKMHRLQAAGSSEKKERTSLHRCEILRPHSLKRLWAGTSQGSLSKIASPFPSIFNLRASEWGRPVPPVWPWRKQKYSATPFRHDAPFIEANGATLR